MNNQDLFVFDYSFMRFRVKYHLFNSLIINMSISYIINDMNNRKSIKKIRKICGIGN